MLLDYSMYYILHTLMKEVTRILETRIRDLPLRCVPDYTTRVLYSKLTFRPEYTVGLVSGFKEKRRKFNTILGKVAEARAIQTISFDEITTKFSETIFHSHGNIARDGYRQIWMSLNNAIEDLDLLGAQRSKVFTTPTAATGETTEMQSQCSNISSESWTQQAVQFQQIAPRPMVPQDNQLDLRSVLTSNQKKPNNTNNKHWNKGKYSKNYKKSKTWKRNTDF